MFSFMKKRSELLPSQSTLPGRSTPLQVPAEHFVNRHALKPPFPEGLERGVFGMGCFWGAERLFWEADGVWTTAVGYAGGFTPNPTYEEVCSGGTGHAEVVLAVFDPAKTSFEDMLRVFWEGHDPTQGMRQGNDVGTQYRSAIYTGDAFRHGAGSDVQQKAAETTRDAYQERLTASGLGEITTDIRPASAFYYAEG